MKLSVWVTRNCNMNCSYCYEDGVERCDVPIEEDVYIKKCIEFINSTCHRTSSKKLFLKFFGGEPLLKYPFIKKFVREINEKVSSEIRVFYSITTNGTLMNDEIIDWFKENRVECALSIDGSERVYSINRHYKNGDSSWNTIDALIPKLVDKGLKLSARATYNSKTADSLYESVTYLVDRGFTILKVVPDYFDLNWSPDIIPILKKQIEQIYHLESTYPALQINLDDDNLFIGRKGCAGGYSMFSLDRNGDIYPCTYAVDNSSFVIGNIFDTCDIPLRYTDGSNLQRPSCIGCRYYKCCKSAECLYGNYMMSGTFEDVNEFFCSYRKILYEMKEMLL